MSWDERLMEMSIEELEDAVFRLGAEVKGRRSRRGYAEAIQRAILTELMRLARSISYTHVCILMERHIHRKAHRCLRRKASPQAEMTFASLSDFGLAWRDAEYWYVDPSADCVCLLSAEELEALSREEELTEQTESWLRLYGVLPVAEAAERISGAQADELFRCWSSFFGRSGFRQQDGQVWLIHPTIETPEWLIAAVNTNEMQGIPYAPFTEEDRQNMEAMGVPSQGRAMEICRSLFRREVLESGLLFIPLVMLQKGSMEDAAAFLRTLPKTKGRPDSVEQALVERCLNHFPRWKFKGHSADEMQKLRPPMQEDASVRRFYH